MAEKRYYYKKDDVPAFNLKNPISNYNEIENKDDYVEIDKEEWDSLMLARQINN